MFIYLFILFLPILILKIGLSYAAHGGDIDSKTHELSGRGASNSDEKLAQASTGNCVTTATPIVSETGLGDAAGLPASNVEVEQVTIKQINDILEALKNNSAVPTNLMYLVNRLVPFARSLPGTPLAFKNEKKKLHAIISSPIYDEASWRLFITFSNADLFAEYIYRIINTDGNGNVKDEWGYVLDKEAGDEFLRKLSKPARMNQLGSNPAIACRTFMIKQELIMRHIIKKYKIFGEVFDSWGRIEFQRSLNAHLHMILSIKNPEKLNELVEGGCKLSEVLAETTNMKVTVQLVPPWEEPIEPQVKIMCISF
jgi:Helitron helicase-like domain at N-terminus